MTENADSSISQGGGAAQTEPPRIYRRLFFLSYAATGVWSRVL